MRLETNMKILEEYIKECQGIIYKLKDEVVTNEAIYIKDILLRKKKIKGKIL